MSLLKEFTACKKGDHDWHKILTSEGYDTDRSVRWCSTCGCIVVDVEVDGRVWKPGGALSITAPKIYRYTNRTLKNE
jgi:hypothetical protein